MGTTGTIFPTKRTRGISIAVGSGVLPPAEAGGYLLVEEDILDFLRRFLPVEVGALRIVCRIPAVLIDFVDPDDDPVANRKDIAILVRMARPKLPVPTDGLVDAPCPADIVVVDLYENELGAIGVVRELPGGQLELEFIGPTHAAVLPLSPGLVREVVHAEEVDESRFDLECRLLVHAPSLDDMDGLEPAPPYIGDLPDLRRILVLLRRDVTVRQELIPGIVEGHPKGVRMCEDAVPASFPYVESLAGPRVDQSVNVVAKLLSGFLAELANHGLHLAIADLGDPVA